MAVISLVREAIGATWVEFFSNRTLPVSSSTTSTDCEPNGTARAAALEIVINTAAKIFLIMEYVWVRLMVGRQMAAEHQNAKGQSRTAIWPLFHWLIASGLTYIIVNQGKSKPTARFYRKKGIALSQGLICERKF